MQYISADLKGWAKSGAGLKPLLHYNPPPPAHDPTSQLAMARLEHRLLSRHLYIAQIGTPADVTRIAAAPVHGLSRVVWELVEQRGSPKATVEELHLLSAIAMELVRDVLVLQLKRPWDEEQIPCFGPRHHLECLLNRCVHTVCEHVLVLAAR